MHNAKFLVPTDVQRYVKANGAWGNFTAMWSPPEMVAMPIAMSSGAADMDRIPIQDQGHFLNFADPVMSGRWYLGTTDLAKYWAGSRARGIPIPVSAFREQLPDGFLTMGDSYYAALIHAPDLTAEEIDGGVPAWSAWLVNGDFAFPVRADAEPEAVAQLQLEPDWPAALMSQLTVMLVGVGSIGSATAVSLARYGIGRLVLVDPDRLEYRNLVRHQAGSAGVGKFKVDAMVDELKRVSPQLEVQSVPASVTSDANIVRELMAGVDLVVGSTDGVEPRRVLSHIARRARKTLVLACVLENGALGEVLRLRPWPNRGCLSCQRRALSVEGAFDPEPDIDRPYGAGTRHETMTAVGADLQLIGDLSAKVAVGSLLEARGFPDQRLSGEHLLIALRPTAKWLPPYDLVGMGATKWLSSSPPIDDCPTCRP